MKDSQKGVPNLVGPTERGNKVAAVDLLGELVKNLFDVYQKSTTLRAIGLRSTPN